MSIKKLIITFMTKLNQIKKKLKLINKFHQTFLLPDVNNYNYLPKPMSRLRSICKNENNLQHPLLMLNLHKYVDNMLIITAFHAIVSVNCNQ